MKKAKEIKELSKANLEKELLSLRVELKNSRFSKAKGEDKNPLKRRILRRSIARVLTIQKEKGLN